MVTSLNQIYSKLEHVLNIWALVPQITALSGEVSLDSGQLVSNDVFDYYWVAPLFPWHIGKYKLV